MVITRVMATAMSVAGNKDSNGAGSKNDGNGNKEGNGKKKGDGDGNITGDGNINKGSVQQREQLKKKIN